MVTLSWDDIASAAQRLAISLQLSATRHVPDWKVGTIILGRGGLATATMLSRFYPQLFTRATYLPCAKVHRLTVPQVRVALRPLWGSDSVLLLDEIYDSGATLQAVEQLTLRCMPGDPAGVWKAVLVLKHAKDRSRVAHYGLQLDTTEWIHFPWEVETHGRSDS